MRPYTYQMYSGNMILQPQGVSSIVLLGYITLSMLEVAHHLNGNRLLDRNVRIDRSWGLELACKGPVWEALNPCNKVGS